MHTFLSLVIYPVLYPRGTSKVILKISSDDMLDLGAVRKQNTGVTILNYMPHPSKEWFQEVSNKCSKKESAG